MNKIFLTTALLLCALSLFAQAYARVEIQLNGRSMADLAALGLEADHGHLAPQRNWTTDLSYEEIEAVRQAGFDIHILIPDVKRWYVEQNKAAQSVSERALPCQGFVSNPRSYFPTPQNYKPGSMMGYPTYAEILAELDQMKTLYPDLITQRAFVSDTILTHEGRPMWFVKMSDQPNQDEDEPEALYTALHHSREPVGVTQMLFFMWYLLENYDSKPEIKYLLDHTELYFIPCVNPDGYLYNELTDPQGGGLWRKNRRDNGDGTWGVDLNRNYGFQWGIDNIGSSPNPNSAVYRGPAPFSEPETRMMRDFCRNRHFQMALNYHTFGNLLIYPWAFSEDIADPYLPHLGGLLASENGFRAGTPTQTVGYSVNGSSDDWMFGETEAFTFTPESGPGSFGFWPPTDTIDGLNKVTQWSNLTLAWSMLRFATATDRSGNELNKGGTLIPVAVRRFGLQDGPVQVSLQPVGSGTNLTVSPAFVTLDLPQMGDSLIYFAVQTNGPIPPQSFVQLELAVNNGGFVLRDTLTKMYSGGVRLASFSDSLSNASSWTGNWGLTDEYFVSPPTSLTDSPFGPYESNSDNLVALEEIISVPSDLLLPLLTFDARWELEAGYDWLSIEAIDVQSGESAYLCGKYSHTGSPNQPEGIPLWDGVQSEWVREEISLDDWKGKDIQLRFRLVSDSGLNLDGFYLDNLTFSVVDTSLVTAVAPSAAKPSLRVQPNPASDQIRLIIDQPQNEGVWSIVNALGQVVYQEAVTGYSDFHTNVTIHHWPEGMYRCIWMEAGRPVAHTVFMKR